MYEDRKRIVEDEAEVLQSKGKGTSDKGRNRRRKKTAGNQKKREKSTRSANLDSAGRDNDPNWYFTDASVADQASTFAFDQYIGTNVEIGVTSQTGGVETQSSATIKVPSILTMVCSPSPGDVSAGVKGVNIAALRTYTQLSSRNAKTSNYAPQDISTLILAFGEVVSILEHIRRAFGVAYTYNQRNRALPYRLLQTMGFDPDEFLSNQANFRLQFNSWITALNKVPFPTNIAYVYKCMDMYQRVYLDSDSQMAQVVFARPATTWIMNETLEDTGTVLVTTKLPLYKNSTISDVTASWKTWEATVDSQISALLNSATFNYIFSDILMLHDKYGMPLTRLAYLDFDYAVVPEYNRNFMLQVHNATPVGYPMDTAPGGGFTNANNVYHDPNFNMLSYKPAWTCTDGYKFVTTPIVDMDVPEASVVDRIEATRYIALSTMYKVGSTTYLGYSLPDHYVNEFIMYMGNGEADSSADYSMTDEVVAWWPATINLGNRPLFARISQIDWAPLLYYFDDSDADNVQIGVLGDLNYWTTVDKQWVSNVNDLAFQALFDLR